MNRFSIFLHALLSEFTVTTPTDPLKNRGALRIGAGKYQPRKPAPHGRGKKGKGW